MVILEVQQQIEVITPKGKGRIWLVTEYGAEIEKLFTIIINETGEFWEFTNKNITATSNITFGRNIVKIGT
jgi:hypothetical protein